MSLNYYSEEEENNKEESINKYRDIFLEYEKEVPTLKKALKQMFISSGCNKIKAKELTEDIINKCKKKIDKNFNEIKDRYKNITKDDAYIICSYTCESKEKNYSPYKILNQNLVSENRKDGINNISKYLYILITSLRKLDLYIPPNDNKFLYRCITHKVGLDNGTPNDNYIPYKIGNIKIFWGFTSTSTNIKTSYGFLKKEEKIKTGTVFILEGYLFGYDITLFNYYGEKEILLEPERKFEITNVLPPLNDVTHINCKILKTPLPLDFTNINSKIEKIMDENNINFNNYNNSNKDNFICEIRMEINIDDKDKYISGIGLLCNISLKHIKVLITHSHIIDKNILNNEKKLIYFNNNKKKEINMKRSRYKYINEELNITIIEIFDDEEDKNNFIEIDEYIKSKDYIDEDVYIINYNKNKIEYKENKIKEKNNEYFICNIKENEGEIIILKENKKLIGIIKDNNNDINDKKYIPMNIIINKINFIKCIYEIKEDNIGKEIQILNRKVFKDVNKNEEIEKKIELIINGEIKKNILKYKFNKEGLYEIYIIIKESLNNISYMFSRCSKLKEINLLSFDTKQITDIRSIFDGCIGLEKIDLSSFDTKRVKNMSNMFYECSKLKEINLSSFDTRQVTDMSFMFFGCSELEKIDLSSFDTRQVENMSNMFHGCSGLEEINISSFETNKVIDMRSMFQGCSELREIKLSLFDTSHVENMRSMFYGCSGLEEINLSSFNTTKVTDMSSMFSGCSELKEINLSSFNTSQVNNMSFMFYKCSGLEKIYLSSFNTMQVTDMSNMFSGCTKLKELNLSSFKTTILTNTRNMFDRIPDKCKIICNDKRIKENAPKNNCLIF